jgi:hypothetical protein
MSIQKYHCVTQLREDSWEYRLKHRDDPPNDDDLVSWEDYLALFDRMTNAVTALDTRRMAQIDLLRADLAEAQADLKQARNLLRVSTSNQ